MSKLKQIECPICKKHVSTRTFARHVRALDDHKILLEKASELEKKKLEEFDGRNCEACEKPLKNAGPDRLHNACLLKIAGFEIRDWNGKKYCSNKCSTKTPWNAGLTKEEHPSLLKISKDRMGDGNPIHKVLSDDVKREEWLQALKDGKENSEWLKWRRDRTLEEVHGEEKAREIREYRRELFYKKAEERGRFPNEGNKYSEETKEKISRSVARQIASGQINKTSQVQLRLYDALLEKFPNEEWELEWLLDFYSLDIAIPKKKLCIEVDGDFWHVNEEQGFTLKYESQRRALENDKRKNSYLTNAGWYVIRIWESEINEDLDNALEKIKNLLEDK